MKKQQTFDKPPAVCVVTGGSGFVGQRLCEMLIERGAEKVISFDIVPMPADSPLLNDKRFVFVNGDIRDAKVRARCFFFVFFLFSFFLYRL